MDCKIAGVTVSMAAGDEVIESKVAVMLTDPGVRAVAMPFVPAVLLIVDITVLDDAQVANVVRSCVLASINVPVAANCCVDPWGTLTTAGVTAIDCT